MYLQNVGSVIIGRLNDNSLSPIPQESIAIDRLAYKGAGAAQF